LIITLQKTSARDYNGLSLLPHFPDAACPSVCGHVDNKRSVSQSDANTVEGYVDAQIITGVMSVR